MVGGICDIAVTEELFQECKHMTQLDPISNREFLAFKLGTEEYGIDMPAWRDCSHCGHGVDLRGGALTPFRTETYSG